jgi:hypothetical protein
MTDDRVTETTETDETDETDETFVSVVPPLTGHETETDETGT